MQPVARCVTAMRKKRLGGRHIAIERGLMPAWSGLPFRREIRNAAIVLRKRTVPSVKKGVEPMEEQRPCRA